MVWSKTKSSVWYKNQPSKSGSYEDELKAVKALAASIRIIQSFHICYGQFYRMVFYVWYLLHVTAVELWFPSNHAWV